MTTQGTLRENHGRNRSGKSSIVLIAALAALLYAGCDDALSLGTAAQQREERERSEREATRMREEKAGLSAAIKVAVEGKRKLLERRLCENEKVAAALKSDLDGLGKAIATAMDRKTASGEEPKHEVKVLNVLKDETVNAFAVKYLGSDFSAARERFMTEVRNGRAEESRYRKALEDADATYASSNAQTKDWNIKTREQRDAEIARLRSEIARLETRRGLVRKEVETLTKSRMIGSRRQEMERTEKGVVLRNKMFDVESEIAKKRYQLDHLTNPSNPVGVEYDAVMRTERMRSNADYAHRRRLEDIERTMKPKRLLSDIVTACESETFGKLQKTIGSKLETSEKEVSEAKEKLDQLKAVEVSLPLAEMQDLRNFRKQVLAL